MDQGDLRGRVHKPSRGVLGFCMLVPSILCTCLWVISSICTSKLPRDLPHTFFLYLVLYSKTKRWKQKGLHWFENQGALLYLNSNISIFLILFSPWDLLKQGWIKNCINISERGYTYDGPLKGYMYILHILCNMNPIPLLTFPFEFSSTTHPFGFWRFSYRG
jgi:hypothetical protein